MSALSSCVCGCNASELCRVGRLLEELAEEQRKRQESEANASAALAAAATLAAFTAEEKRKRLVSDANASAALAAAAALAESAAEEKKMRQESDTNAAEDKRKREEAEQFVPLNRLFMKYKCNEAEKNVPVRQLLDESMKIVNALLNISVVSNPAQQVGVTPEGLEKEIEIEFMSSRRTFRNVYCHGWTVPELDHAMFIDSLFRKRYKIGI